ncbi:MAG: hypothetical protein M1831_005739 [Alyxoria varia]|nr:MAG: hypothetical protein M1831_005739 [Alyxoria varia]
MTTYLSRKRRRMSSPEPPEFLSDDYHSERPDAWPHTCSPTIHDQDHQDKENIPPSPPSSPPLKRFRPTLKPTTHHPLPHSRRISSSTTRTNGPFQQDLEAKKTIPTTPITTTKAKNKQKLTQLTIDLGQGHPSKKCKDCGMEFIPSNEEDSKIHAKWHASCVGGVDVGSAATSQGGAGGRVAGSKWRGARTVGTFARRIARASGDSKTKHRVATTTRRGRRRESSNSAANDMIIEITCDSSTRVKNLAARVLEVAEAELGAVKTERESLWEEFEPRAAPERPEPRHKVYLYVQPSTAKCVGLLLTEKIRSARAVRFSKKSGRVATEPLEKRTVGAAEATDTSPTLEGDFGGVCDQKADTTENNKNNKSAPLPPPSTALPSPPPSSPPPLLTSNSPVHTTAATPPPIPTAHADPENPPSQTDPTKPLRDEPAHSIPPDADTSEEPPTLSPTLSPALLGISRIWVSREFRGLGIARDLLDSAASSLHTSDVQTSNATDRGGGVPVRWREEKRGEKEKEKEKTPAQALPHKNVIAFSQPTAAGIQLARRWFGRWEGWMVYRDEEQGVDVNVNVNVDVAGEYGYS